MENHNYYNRWATREVSIGNSAIGGKNPIRIQSMTNTSTMDTAATVKQSIQLIEAGCEYIRITTPTIKEAKNLIQIKNELRKAGFDVPIIADVHFNRKVAEEAARLVEKVRINPGNYIDNNLSTKIKYTDAEYQFELEKIAKNIYPLLKVCRENGTALRIGTNHGSLSDRILNRYGDTAEGMATSAMEFIRICRSLNFHNIVVSMKSSQPQMMVYSTRLLVEMMISEGMNYPIHLGVTEAGDGEDGRIKSAAGIGALLAEGIGDTIRVSLTELPEHEIPVAKKMIAKYNSVTASYFSSFQKTLKTAYAKRKTNQIDFIGGKKKPIVIGSTSQIKENSMLNPDIFYFNKGVGSFQKERNRIIDFSKWDGSLDIIPLFEAEEWLESLVLPEILHFVKIDADKFKSSPNSSIVEKLQHHNNCVVVLESKEVDFLSAFRRITNTYSAYKLEVYQPIIFKIHQTQADDETFILEASAGLSSLFIDGIGDGIWLTGKSDMDYVSLSYNILQANHLRFSKTEFIACPGCGRTQYNISEVLQQVKSGTNHLKGLKIAIMGCIVNGPGEMAGADYGVVGSQKGKVNLYKGKEVVRKNIDEQEALTALIELITINGDWIPR
ncbi:MAG: (E)-4-hydroxy-3-methylbut-2-enyl-diphosphate synthase [Bacteroidota bacterium]